MLLAAVFLATLELLLKEAPKHHWHGIYIDVLLVLCLFSFAAAVHQCLTRAAPFVELRRFGDRSFLSAAC